MELIAFAMAVLNSELLLLATSQNKIYSIAAQHSKYHGTAADASSIGGKKHKIVIHIKSGSVSLSPGPTML